jgi:hypothetical protein
MWINEATRIFHAKYALREAGGSYAPMGGSKKKAAHGAAFGYIATRMDQLRQAAGT